MAISEESRHHLYCRLDAVVGPEEAATLMEHLPPVGWDAGQGASLRAEFEHDLRVLSVRFVTVVITAFSVLLAAISVATAVIKL